MDTLKIKVSKSNIQLFSMHAWFYFCLFFMLATLTFTYDALAFRGNAAKKLENRMAVLSEKLQLSDTQIDQIRPILENQIQKRNKIFEAYSSQGHGDRSALRDQMWMLREETHSHVMDMLTEEQIAQYEAWQQERYQKRQRQAGRSRKQAGSKIY